MLRTRSIRFRLTVWYAAVLTVGLGLFSGLVYWTLRHQLISDVDRELEGRVNRFERYFRTESSLYPQGEVRDELDEFCQALPPASYIHLTGANGFRFFYPASTAGSASDFRIAQRQFTANGELFHLEAGSPIDDVTHMLDRLRLLLWSLIPVVIAIACIGGAWLSGRALKPVQDISVAALTISIENLAGRLPVPATGDEIARLTLILNSMLARLDSAVKALSQFVADASHELRTPLAVIRTSAELALRRDRTSESYRDSLREVASEAERMTHLVENLLILARSDAHLTDMPLAPIDVRHVLRDVCTEMHGLAQLRQIRIHPSLGDQPAMIAGNQPALHRLFLVLLDNSLKYSPAGGEVNLTIHSGDSQVSVAIEDFGAGISEADLPHIFRRFYRADKARTSTGHGLGLSLAESIARAHGASIHVRSTEGASSTFQVLFPIRETRSAQAPFNVGQTC